MAPETTFEKLILVDLDNTLRAPHFEILRIAFEIIIGISSFQNHKCSECQACKNTVLGIISTYL